MDIKEFRTRFPQYDDMSDDQLTKAVFNKLYAGKQDPATGKEWQATDFEALFRGWKWPDSGDAVQPDPSKQVRPGLAGTEPIISDPSIEDIPAAPDAPPSAPAMKVSHETLAADPPSAGMLAAVPTETPLDPAVVGHSFGKPVRQSVITDEGPITYEQMAERERTEAQAAVPSHGQLVAPPEQPGLADPYEALGTAPAGEFQLWSRRGGVAPQWVKSTEDVVNALDRLRAGGARGTANAGSALWSTMAGAAQMAGFEDSAKWLDKQAEGGAAKAKSYVPSTDYQAEGFWGALQRAPVGALLEATGENAPNLAVAMAGAMAGGAPGGIMTGFSIEGGAARQEALEAGATPEEANYAMATTGTINAMLEYLPVNRLLRVKYGDDVAEEFQPLIKRMFDQAIAEGGTETLQEFDSAVTRKLIYDPDLDLFSKEQMSQYAQAGVIGALLGSQAEVATVPLANASNKEKQAWIKKVRDEAHNRANKLGVPNWVINDMSPTERHQFVNWAGTQLFRQWARKEGIDLDAPPQDPLAEAQAATAERDQKLVRAGAEPSPRDFAEQRAEAEVAPAPVSPAVPQVSPAPEQVAPTAPVPAAPPQVVHTMPDGTTMAGPEHQGAVPGSEQVAPTAPEVVPTAPIMPEQVSETPPVVEPAPQEQAQPAPQAPTATISEERRSTDEFRAGMDQSEAADVVVDKVLDDFARKLKREQTPLAEGAVTQEELFAYIERATDNETWAGPKATWNWRNFVNDVSARANAQIQEDIAFGRKKIERPTTEPPAVSQAIPIAQRPSPAGEPSPRAFAEKSAEYIAETIPAVPPEELGTVRKVFGEPGAKLVSRAAVEGSNYQLWETETGDILRITDAVTGEEITATKYKYDRSPKGEARTELERMVKRVGGEIENLTTEPGAAPPPPASPAPAEEAAPKAVKPPTAEPPPAPEAEVSAPAPAVETTQEPAPKAKPTPKETADKVAPKPTETDASAVQPDKAKPAPKAKPKQEKAKETKKAPKDPGERAMEEAAAASKEAVEAQAEPIGIVRSMALPEIVTLARELLGGRLPKIKKWIQGGKYRGVFVASEGDPDSMEIVIAASDLENPEVFSDPDQAAAVLAHEIGHLVDFLPDTTRAKGNILGRIAALKKYMGHWIKTLPNVQVKAFGEKERRAIRGKAIAAVMARHDLKMKDWREQSDLRATHKDEVAAEQKKMLNEAAKESGHVGRDAIMEELKALTQLIKPFDDAADAKYTKYRYKPSELFADAFSVLINNPARLKSQAPLFWESFFGYIASRPKVLATYKEIQDRLTDPSAIQRYRYQQMIEGFRLGNEKRKQAEELAKEGENSVRNLWNWIERTFMDLKSPLYNLEKRAKKMGKTLAPEKSIRYAWEEVAYVGATTRAYIGALQSQVLTPLLYDKKAGRLTPSGIMLDDFSALLMLNRIVNERHSKANPGGLTPEAAGQAIEAIKKKYTPEQFKRLDDATSAFWKVRKEHILGILKESGLLNEQLEKHIFENESYVHFKPVQYIARMLGDHGKQIEMLYKQLGIPFNRGKQSGKAVGATKIHKQIGTFSDIGDPLTETVLRDTALLRGALLNKAISDSISGIRELFGDKAAPPAKRGKGGAFVRPPADTGMELVTYLDKGERVGYYVPSDISRAMRDEPVVVSWFGKILLNPIFRELFVGRNPGFWAFNVLRDLQRGAKNIPSENWADKAIPFLAGAKFFGEWLRSIPAAVLDEMGIPQDVVEEMYKNNALISIESRSGMDSADIGVERQIARHGIAPKRRGHLWKFNPINAPATLKSLWDGWGKVGSALEKSTKVAGYRYLKKRQESMGLHDRELAHIVRTQIGSPDFLRKGKAHGIYNNLFLFSNAIKEGWRGDIEVFKSRPVEYAWKTFQYNIIPTMLKFGLAYGLGQHALAWLMPGLEDEDEARRVMRNVSEYDLTNYVIIPIGMTETGKAIYVRLPMDETGRLIGGVTWKLLNEAFDPESSDSWGEMFGFLGGQAPTVAPMVQIASDVMDYYSNQNPFDHFRQKYAIPPEVFLAAQSGDEEALNRMRDAFGRHLWDKAGGRIVYRFKAESVEGVKTELEKLLEVPGLANMLGRFIKVSDYGTRELARKEATKIRAHKVNFRLKVNEMVISLINENPDKTGEELVGHMIKRLSDKKLLGNLFTGETKEAIEKQGDRLIDKINRYKSRQLSGEVAAWADQVKGLGSADEKAALLARAQQELYPEDWLQLMVWMQSDGELTNNVAKKLDRIKKADDE